MPTDHTSALLYLTTADLLKRAPHMQDFFGSIGLSLPAAHISTADYFAALDAETLEDLGIERQSLTERFTAFLELLEALKTGADGSRIESITIRGGARQERQAGGIRSDYQAW